MGNRQVALGLATAVVGFGGFFAVYSYLVPILTHLTGLSDASTTWVLALYGIGMTLGTLVAGPLTDRALRPTLYGGLFLLGATLLAFYFTVHSTVPALVTLAFMGAMGALVTTPVQMLLMAKAKNAPTMAAASNHSAFNLANAAWRLARRPGHLGLGWGWASPALVGATLAAAGPRARPPRGLHGPRYRQLHTDHVLTDPDLVGARADDVSDPDRWRRLTGDARCTGPSGAGGGRAGRRLATSIASSRCSPSWQGAWAGARSGPTAPPCRLSRARHVAVRPPSPGRAVAERPRSPGRRPRVPRARV